ncbi:MAG: hypothetical protein IAA31_06235 [Candidatus Anaerobiospirillum merdipullorum]|uniref:Uncharacterized protein n=1 Tax=Candidatus Anaerobiospirillum merdipullorum TaxID=2838450 RepID=A0A9E2KP82_9GAMM|nr:hypothetical protein [Candidatus Anaerobiospirillum merdipullorum]
MHKVKLLQEAQDLSAAYKRLSNILSKDDKVAGNVNPALQQEKAEQQ